MSFDKLQTEKVNPNTENIDILQTIEICKLINQEDKLVSEAVKAEIEKISKLVDIAATCLEKDGRIFYVGTGTSGRLGVLDASEIPPTFNANPNQFIGIIAGGDEALRLSKPTAEDDHTLGRQILEDYKLGENDLVIGLTASGRTPFVKEALRFAREQSSYTGLICCNKNAEISPLVDIAIEVDTGPEVIVGSTRMKAGSAQKMVLNMFSTATMIRHGKVYKNLMIDLSPTNEKLIRRAIFIIQEATGVSEKEARDAFYKCNQKTKTAIVHLLTGLSIKEAEQKIEERKGRVREILEDYE